MRTERTVTLHPWKWTITPGDRLWIVEYGRHLAQRRVHKSDSKQKYLIKSLSSLRDWEGYIRRESVKPTCVYMCVCVMWWGREYRLSRPLLRFYKEVFLLSFGWSRSFASSWNGVGVGGQGREWLGGRFWSWKGNWLGPSIGREKRSNLSTKKYKQLILEGQCLFYKRSEKQAHNFIALEKSCNLTVNTKQISKWMRIN